MKCLSCIWQSCICISVLLVFVQSAFADLSDSRKKQLWELVTNEDRYDCKYLNSEEKEFLKGYFYEVKKRTNNPRARDYQLLQVGDEATIKHFISEFEAVGWQYREAPEHSGQARFIEVYAPTMFREEPFVDTPGDTPGPPLSYAITNSIVRLLRESPQLSAEVRHWAFSLPDGELDLPKNRTILRQWWRANERHFRERNYQAVQPPSETSILPPPGDAPPRSPDTQPPATPPPNASTAPEADAKNSSLVAVLITALCASLLALACWLMARSEKPRS